MRVALLFIDFYNVALAVKEDFPDGSARKESACHAGEPGSVPQLGTSTEEGLGYPLQCSWEKAMAPHSSTLAWKTPWTEEPGGLQSMGTRLKRLSSSSQYSWASLWAQLVKNPPAMWETWD